ncbi:MAG: hypothetical protein U1C74_21720 [Phenylobacterium sp.]|nr:hypothetical protein [Phenylobacterium sp.]
MATLIGFKADQVDTALTSGKTFSPGDVAEDDNGKKYVYVKASSAIALYDVVTFDETYITTVAGVSTSNDARGDLIGVAPVAIASGSYGWVQIYGPCTMNVLASCAANVRINTTATAGFPDDDAGSGSIQLEGIYLTAARTASSGSAAGILNMPIQGATL